MSTYRSRLQLSFLFSIPALSSNPVLARNRYPNPSAPILPLPLLLLVAALFLCACEGRAENLRVVAWNMETGGDWLVNPTAAKSNSVSVARNAAVLHELNPDVIILYDAPDWKACDQLASALEPASYSVHVCSAFAAPGNKAGSGRQIAILAKQKAYFSWCEEWENGKGVGAGGFAFAAIQAGSQRIGVFVAQAGRSSQWGPTAPEALQWAKAVGAFKRWTVNKLDAAIVGFRTEATLEPAAMEAGLARTFVQTLTLPPGTANSFSATLPADPAALPVLFFGQAPLLCDLDVAPGIVLRAEARRVDASLSLLQPARFLDSRVVLASAVLVTVLGLVALIWTVVALKRRVRRLAAPPAVALLGTGDASAYADTLVVAPRSATATSMQNTTLLDGPPALPVVNIESDAATTSTQSQLLRHAGASSEPGREPLPESVKAGVIANLTQWLKNAFVRRVLADREVLLQGQQQASDKAAAMDARLARIELQIQQQTRIYEERILELTRELNASRQENRALILAKIAQVKSEMEAARARIARSEP